MTLLRKCFEGLILLLKPTSCLLAQPFVALAKNGGDARNRTGVQR